MTTCSSNHLSPPVRSLLLLGPTGAGKTPLGNEIARSGLFNHICHHLDFGEELRCAVTDRIRSADYTEEELDFLHGVLERGLLLENEHFPLAEKIIGLFLSRVQFFRHDLLVLNGIPRHAGQARDIAAIADIQALIVLDCSADDVFNRIAGNSGGDRTERADDDRTLIEKKLLIFRERTAPLIEHFENLNRAIYRVRVTATMTPDMAYRAVSTLAAAHPPVAFIAEPPHR